MKVICINDNFYNPVIKPICKFGETYTVISEYNTDEQFYQLAEHIGFFYAKEGFAPLSSIDETTFERNYKTETV